MSAMFPVMLGMAFIVALVTEVLAEIHSDHFASVQLTVGEATIEVTFAPGPLAYLVPKCWIG
jgi:hypothetical protein